MSSLDAFISYSFLRVKKNMLRCNCPCQSPRQQNVLLLSCACIDTKPVDFLASAQWKTMRLHNKNLFNTCISMHASTLPRLPPPPPPPPPLLSPPPTTPLLAGRPEIFHHHHHQTFSRVPLTPYPISTLQHS